MPTTASEACEKQVETPDLKAMDCSDERHDINSTGADLFIENLAIGRIDNQSSTCL
jgi:hypothetical protein